MADGSWLLIYRSYSTDDLSTEHDNLIGQLTTLSSQTVGNKSFTRDLRELKNRLEAVVFVMNERGLPYGYIRNIVFDFSGIDGGTRGQPAGVNDELSY